MNYLPFVTAIIALCTNLTKKKWWLNFIGAVFIAIIFSMLTGAMNVFYLLISIERFIKFILKKRKEKTNKEEENTLEINSDNGSKEN
jgi:predicted membrane protein